MRRRFGREQLKNRRFMHTEEAILEAYFDSDVDEKMTGKLARKAGVSRATIHRHHGTIFAIKTDYENYLLHEYKLLMSQKKHKDMQAEDLLFTTLVFVMMNKKIFVPLLKDGAENLVWRMMKVIEPGIKERYFSLEKSFDVYVGEVYEILRQWAKVKLSDAEFKNTFDNLVYLTKTMGQRLDRLK